MIKKKYRLFITILGLFLSIFDLQADLSVSVIIPCHFKHAKYLPELLHAYEEQSVLPDEIVIALSEVGQVSQDILDMIQSDEWEFPVKCILLRNKAFAGENRNTACSVARGDIFLCQDADDFPTPNRVEVVKYIFSTHHVDYLLHSYFFGDEIEDQLELITEQPFEKLRKIYVHTYDEIWGLPEKIHFGNAALRKSLFDSVKWSSRPTAQDVEFCQKVLHKKSKVLVLREPLVIYHIELSSWKCKVCRTRQKRRF